VVLRAKCIFDRTSATKKPKLKESGSERMAGLEVPNPSQDESQEGLS
jgi:hypothetical protein